MRRMVPSDTALLLLCVSSLVGCSSNSSEAAAAGGTGAHSPGANGGISPVTTWFQSGGACTGLDATSGTTGGAGGAALDTTSGGWTTAGTLQSFGGSSPVTTLRSGGNSSAGGASTVGSSAPSGGSSANGGESSVLATSSTGGVSSRGGVSSTGRETTLGSATSGGTASSAGGMSTVGGSGSPDGGASAAGGTVTNSGELLSETGLYESDMETLRPGVMPYAPRFELWSDGASKRRWLYLPPGTVIDTEDPDFWQFPVGTKVWKEFSKNGKRVETRIIEKVSTRLYRMVAYLWREDLSDAIAVPDGQSAALGTDHDVPSSVDCDTCHVNQPGRIVGVSALQLDYDTPDLSVAKLWARGQLSHPLPSAHQLPGNATAQAAIGLIHANCGICHNPNSTLPYKALDLWQRVGLLTDVAATPLYQSSVGVASGTSSDDLPAVLVTPGHPEQSALLARMKTREQRLAMPPLASKVVDTDAVATVSAFIAELE